MHSLDLLVLMLIVTTIVPANSVKFWHVTDFHYDPTYNDTSYNDTGISCYGRTAERPRYGNHKCDSPWLLVNSSVYAMKDIEPNPDFIIWTGDDTPHGKSLGTDEVLSIIEKETKLLMEVFPNTIVYSALGNHDYHPKHQMPPYNNTVYERVADLWKPWIKTSDGDKTFRNGGCYTLPISNGLRAVMLNTVYYYKNNKVTNPDTYQDPARQFDWFDKLMVNASNNNEKVYVIGHVPPGNFEKHISHSWFYPFFNEKFNKLILKHSKTIAATFFAHHHTDTFRVFYNSTGSPEASALLAPSVTPWETTLPRIIGSASNNPGIRLFEYTTTPDKLDYTQYYTDIEKINENGTLTWAKEYTASQAYDIPDVSAKSLDLLIKKMDKDNSSYFKKYYTYNGVSVAPDEKCEGMCKSVQICAIKNVGYNSYDQCLHDRQPASSANAFDNNWFKLIISILSFVLVALL